MWKYEDIEFFYDSDELIRFKVRNVEFNHSMTVVGTTNAEGLGLVRWWINE